MVLKLDNNPLFARDQENREFTSPIKIDTRAATVIVAKGTDGDTDDINEAIAMLPAEGGTIQIKEGTWTATSTPYINVNKNNIRFVGTGHGTIIECGDTNQTLMSMSSQTNIQIDSITFHGRNKAGTTGISITSGGIIKINNCQFLSLLVNSVVFTSSLRCWVTNNYFAGLTIGDCIEINETGWCILTGNIFSTALTTNSAIYLHSNSDLNVICNNWIGGFNGAGGIGIEIAAATEDENLITSNVLQDNSTNISDSGTSTEIAHNQES